MLVINLREFRNRQASYFDKADEGVEILVQRGKNKSCRIVPVNVDDTVVDREYILAPDEDFHRAISMEEFATGAKEHIRGLYRQEQVV